MCGLCGLFPNHVHVYDPGQRQRFPYSTYKSQTKAYRSISLYAWGGYICARLLIICFSTAHTKRCSFHRQIGESYRPHCSNFLEFGLMEQIPFVSAEGLQSSCWYPRLCSELYDEWKHKYKVADVGTGTVRSKIPIVGLVCRICVQTNTFFCCSANQCSQRISTSISEKLSLKRLVKLIRERWKEPKTYNIFIEHAHMKCAFHKRTHKGRNQPIFRGLNTLILSSTRVCTPVYSARSPSCGSPMSRYTLAQMARTRTLISLCACARHMARWTRQYRTYTQCWTCTRSAFRSICWTHVAHIVWWLCTKCIHISYVRAPAQTVDPSRVCDIKSYDFFCVGYAVSMNHAYTVDAKVQSTLR